MGSASPSFSVGGNLRATAFAGRMLGRHRGKRPELPPFYLAPKTVVTSLVSEQRQFETDDESGDEAAARAASSTSVLAAAARELIIPTALGYSGSRGDEDRDSWPSGSWDRSRTMSVLPTPREVDEEEEEAEKKKQQARKYEGVEEGAPVQEKPKEVAKPKPFDFVADWAKSKHRAEDAVSRADALAAAVKAAERELEEQGLPLPYTAEEAREYSADIWKVFVQTR